MAKVKKRVIAVLTGKRGGSGAMITLVQSLRRDPAVKVVPIATDMHLSSFFGGTVKEVEKWYGKTVRVPTKQKGDSHLERGKALARTVDGLLEVFARTKPDILVTLGDRGEVLAACMAALELNIPVAHILGGDVSGNRDGVRIHAVTKLAHLHFPANRDAYERILNLGEEEWRVFDYGSTYIDLVVRGDYTPERIVRKKYGIKPDEPYCICIQHPTTLDEEHSYREARAVYMALKKKGWRTLIVWPCNDQGYSLVLKALKEFENVPQFSVHKNIQAEDFWGLMAGASVMVGNSSSGLMETPYFNLPSITVGHRQDGRVRDTNIIAVEEPTTAKVFSAINLATSPTFKKRCRNHYLFGRGRAGERIAHVLRTVQLGGTLLRKRITY
ncbi:UDP-N-acetylglucosamine 2-epimerase (hydrolyzing) [Candidatus Kaiserbacteria bacterium CG10_big_fil_rev_8_21_14_0_10_59_10]|uniref:UDP-N-acetylglucosamine 2-epimerase (Hydrolyzing) n=1 Tax=Candidatus Kaiserbacteria bacterium CG10_big_fil_rev_8_21_14_0_10_59_10 TaxID=1974612 RepID=A0A2H0U7Q8_9BACT|nr:MAG: UDP-N-acetylglucosamine 2-epimerase (hydrolyzing) [Candidatus Kaiserbacteria bacterium CG10_big_fil_rev_8_21_14_0_10_59_10]